MRSVRNGIVGCVCLLLCAVAYGASEGVILKSYWPHQRKPFGLYDKAAAQRGFLVFSQVCGTCHSLNFFSFRSLASIGFSASQIKELASSWEVEDGPDEEGEMFSRPARPSDIFPSPYANEKAARAANNGAFPPDLSLRVKSHGEDMLYSLLLGYLDPPPPEVKLSAGQFYNTALGAALSMPPPLTEDIADYSFLEEETPPKATIEQMAKDVVSFLAWVSEPHRDARHRLGFKVLAFLLVLTFLVYRLYKRIWSRVV